MPENKEPGRVAYEANALRLGTLKRYPFADQDEEVRLSWAAVESAVLAAHKPERAAGVWITAQGNLVFLILKSVLRVCKGSIGWVAITSDMRGKEYMPLEETDAQTIIKALGGTWPEPQPAPEVKP